MNANQSRRYAGLYSIDIQRLGPLLGGVRVGRVVQRIASCAMCKHTIRHRAGRNALAAMSVLRGEIQQHIRDKHPDALARDSE